MTTALRYVWCCRNVGRAMAAPARTGVSARSRSWTRPRCSAAGGKKGSHSSSRSSQSTSSSPPPPPPLTYPDPPRSVRHHDLLSFLRHAERSGLNPTTTTYVGTYYEYTVAAHLAPLGFSLRRVGGASDRGIDLLGTWALPGPVRPVGASAPSADSSNSVDDTCTTIRVILQCKAGVGQRVGPHLVRELEGAFVGAPMGWRSRAGDGSVVIGVLVTEKPATKGIRDALARSRWPMAYVCCSDIGHIRQMLWNRPAEKTCGLTGLGVTLRHSTGVDERADTHIVLTWQGKPWSTVSGQSA